MNLQVRRSMRRPVFTLAAGLVALVAAVDLLFGYVVFPEPEVDDEGRRTNQGRSERRADITWGVGLAVAGAGLVLWGASDLRRRPVLAADGEGILLAAPGIGGRPWRIGWNEVLAVRSTLDEDETGQSRALALELAHPALGLTDPRGARWEGDLLLIDAGDWSPALPEVADLLQKMLERSRYADRPDMEER